MCVCEIESLSVESVKAFLGHLPPKHTVIKAPRKFFVFYLKKPVVWCEPSLSWQRLRSYFMILIIPYETGVVCHKLVNNSRRGLGLPFYISLPLPLSHPPAPSIITSSLTLSLLSPFPLKSMFHAHRQLRSQTPVTTLACIMWDRQEDWSILVHFNQLFRLHNLI